LLKAKAGQPHYSFDCLFQSNRRQRSRTLVKASWPNLTTLICLNNKIGRKEQSSCQRQAGPTSAVSFICNQNRRERSRVLVEGKLVQPLHSSFVAKSNRRKGTESCQRRAGPTSPPLICLPIKSEIKERVLVKGKLAQPHHSHLSDNKSEERSRVLCQRQAGSSTTLVCGTIKSETKEQSSCQRQAAQPNHFQFV